MLPGTCRASTGIGLPSIKKFLGELSQVESEKESALKSIFFKVNCAFLQVP
jgi:DNA mismatch repair protein MSH6